MSDQKLNSGALFKNDKGDKPNRPDYRGTFTDSNGGEFWLSAWVKKDKNGNSYMSLSAQPKETVQAKSEEVKTVSVSNSDDDLPF